MTRLQTVRTDLFKRELASIFILFVLTAASENIHAQKITSSSSSKNSTGTALHLDKDVIKGKLANGFTYFIQKNEKPKNRVELYLVNKVGSLQEDEDQRGLAHFVEHMGFNGTKHFPKNELMSYLQKAGVSFGNGMNASTDFDATIFQLPIPTDDPQLLKTGLQIMRDWAQDITLDSTEIDKERGVILEEKRMRNNPFFRLQEKSYPLLLNNSRFLVRSPIGTEEILKSFTPGTIRRFYKDWYRPDLQALIIVGDIEVVQMEQQVKRLFSDLKNPLHEKERIEYKVPLSGKNGFIAVTDKEQTGTQIEVLVKHPAVVVKTEADYKKLMMRSFFNAMLGMRFSETALQENPAYITADGKMMSYMAGLDLFHLYVSVKPGELQNGFKAMWEVVERAKRFGFTQTELDRAKEQYLSTLEGKWKEKDKTPSRDFVRKYIDYFLNESVPLSIDAEYALAKKQIAAVSLAQVNDAARYFISDKNRDIIVEAPENSNDKLPIENEVNKWISDVSRKALTPYRDDIAKASFFSERPVGGKVISSKDDTALHYKEWILSNGLRILLKPTSFKNDEILINAYSPGGTSLYNDEDYQSASYAASIISSSGIGNFSPAQLAKFLSGKSIGFNPYINGKFEGFYGSSTPKDFETFLQLLYLFFTKPRKDAAAFQNNVEREEAAIANLGNDRLAAFYDTIRNVLSNYSIREAPPSLEKLRKVNLDRAYEIYKERFANAADFTIVLTGNFDPDRIKPLLEKYLASLPSTGKAEQIADAGIRTPRGIITKKIYKGKQDKANVQIVFSGGYVYNEYNNDQLDALNAIIQIRLFERLRELESGVYTPAVSLKKDKYPYSNYSLSVMFECAPANADKLIAAAMDEIDKIKNNGAGTADIQKFKAEEARNLELSLKSNNFWNYYLLIKYRENEDISEVLRYKENLDRITPQSVQQACKEFLSGEDVITFILLPEAGK